jgi:UDPglucose 6-dehydrogenase
LSALEKFEVGIVGASYVGLTTAACLAYLGHRVTCLDRDEGRMERLGEGKVPFYELGLEEVVARGMRAGRLSFVGSSELGGLVGSADVVFVAVGTPQGDDGSADLSNVASVARQIGRALAGGTARSRERPLVVVNKSTMPVGAATTCRP